MSPLLRLSGPNRLEERPLRSCLAEYMGGRIQKGLAARNRAPQNTGVFADVRSKNLTALPAYCFPAAHSRDLFRGPIEGCDAPL